MAYVYRHIRLDKNIPFYIGIGKDGQGEYRRANSTKFRNRYWKNITAKTEYEVEVMIDDVAWEVACQKEIEFIELYGRRDLKKGPLVNLTDGGEGFANMIFTDEARKNMSAAGRNRKPPSAETREKLSKAAKSRPITKEMREKMASKLRGRPQPEWQRKILSQSAMGKIVPWSEKPILQYSKEGAFMEEFNSVTSASKKLGIGRESITGCLIGRNKRAGDYVFRYKRSSSYSLEIDKIQKSELIGKATMRPVRNIVTGEVYKSAKEAAILEGINYNTLRCKLSGANKNDTNIIYYDSTDKRTNSN